MAVEYLPDFRLESYSTYVWGKFSRFVTPPDMRVIGVEHPVVNLAARTPAGDVATVIGNRIVASEIGRGFTVVRRDDGDDFTLCRLEPPDKPKRQFKSGASHVVLGSDLTQVSAQSRDLLGLFEVPDKNAALYFFRAKVDGSPREAPSSMRLCVYGLVDRSVGAASRVRGRPADRGPARRGARPGNAGGVGQASTPFPVQQGAYYLLVENRQAAQFAPLGVALPLPEQPTYLRYSLEVGDR